MENLPKVFATDWGEAVKVVYVGSPTNPEPYFLARSIESFLGSSNPSATSSNKMTNIESRINEYKAQFNISGLEGPVKLLGSSKPARIYLSDGTYTILGVKSSNRERAIESYYYNMALVFYVINTSRSSKGNELQHIINGEILPTVSKYGEYISYRKDGIGLRKQLTDVIKDKIEAKQLTDSAYMDITDAIYVIRYGLHAPQLRVRLGLKDGENIREHLSQEELQALAKLEGQLAGLLNFGHSIEEALSNPDFIKAHSKPL